MRTSVIKWLAVLFALFHVYNNWFTAVSELWFAAIHFGGFGALCALTFHRPEEDVRRHPALEAWNVLLALLSVGTAAYLIGFEDALYVRQSEFILSDYLFATAAIALAVEFARRTSGWFMPVLVVFSLAYILFLGRYVPGVFAFPGLSLETVLYRSYWSGDGMFGMVANISSRSCSCSSCLAHSCSSPAPETLSCRLQKAWPAATRAARATSPWSVRA